jgi:septal ring-binding cell division protein DamX
VIYGAFATRREAAEALETLPDSFRQFRPYVRAAEAIRAEVRRAPAG